MPGSISIVRPTASSSASRSSLTPAKMGRGRRSSTRMVSRLSGGGEVAVHQVDGDRGLADRGGHPLHGVEAYVARREHSGNACSTRTAPGSAARAPARQSTDVLARSGPVTTYPRSSRADVLASQSVRGCAPMKTYTSSPRRPRSCRRCGRGSSATRGGRRRARRHLAEAAHLDVGRGVDAVDEVARHRRLEAARTHQHHHRRAC